MSEWSDPDTDGEEDKPAPPRQRRGVSLKRSPLARKIVTFNLFSMIVLVIGVLFLNPFHDSLVYQRGRTLISYAELVAGVLEQTTATQNKTTEEGDAPDADALAATSETAEVQTSKLSQAMSDQLDHLNIAKGTEVYLFDAEGQQIYWRHGDTDFQGLEGRSPNSRSTILIDFLSRVWEQGANLLGGKFFGAKETKQSLLEKLAGDIIKSGMHNSKLIEDNDVALFATGAPLRSSGSVVIMVSPAGEIDQLVRQEREQVLQMFIIAILISITLSLVLARAIANPLSDLAAAAEIGSNTKSKRVSAARVRIPDLTSRPDEIGRLSGSLRSMVTALYERIDSNEQFAADVSHEIKNPLASLRSAVGTLRSAKRDDQRERLLNVIEHDVRRLDRLVSDISNASRLDSELVKEQEESFDLLKMVGNINDYMSQEAEQKNVEYIADMPEDKISIDGLEGRLAQVFVNLISNALSFCEDGDAIRVWVRKRENRVLVVVEDTGPGIPDGALGKIFKRFYSERPENQFGNNSGLGLAISKQIVEAHGGVIWAENIRPTHEDITSEPLGARFVVGLPI
ncbi:MAG: ATP-binding protein [Halocynthiibacter sp.]